MPALFVVGTNRTFSIRTSPSWNMQGAFVPRVVILHAETATRNQNQNVVSDTRKKVKKATARDVRKN